mmetsp:Transcript_73425/g.163037  ORF Transcript_73425/g.163037 Transcript_73425/m.163037 type:complete len:92 (+) Transcript_73425:947-1222(+)
MQQVELGLLACVSDVGFFVRLSSRTAYVCRDGACSYMVEHEASISHSKATQMPKKCLKGFACAKRAKQERMTLRSGRWLTPKQIAAKENHT